MASLAGWFSEGVDRVAFGLNVGPFEMLFGMAVLAVGWMHFTGGIVGQTLWSYAGSLRNFDARVGNWATAPRLTALLVGFLFFDLLFAAAYGDAALRAADLLDDSRSALMRRLAVPTVVADWTENLLVLVLVLSANGRLELKRRWDVATEALAAHLREEKAANPKDRWRPWFARKRWERRAYLLGRAACLLLALATTTKFAGVLAMSLLLMMGSAT